MVLALALTPETVGLIDARRLALMPSHAWLVNVARGRHVVTSDLVAALRAGAIGGAALDVTEPEPLPDGHPLWSLPNCMITPHTANTPEMALPLLSARITENVRRYASGRAAARAGGPVPWLLTARPLWRACWPNRRGLRVVAALVLGATTVPEVRAVTGLGVRAVATALARLVDGELVERDKDGAHYLIEHAFRLAAIAAVPESVDEHAGLEAERAKVLRAFVRGGRLVSLPTQRSKRLVVLDVLAQ